MTVNINPSLNSALSKRIYFERNQLRNNSRNLPPNLTSLLMDATLVYCSTEGFSPTDAFQRCEAAVKAIFGLFAFVVNFRKYRVSRTGCQDQDPLSEIVIAPFVTIHDANGKAKYDGYWFYEREIFAPSKLWVSQNNKRIEKWFLQLYTGVRNSNWRKECIDSLGMYFDAYTHCKMERSFLDGWKLLEYICGFPEASHKKVVERAAKPFSRYEVTKQYLNHLRLRRNSATHANKVEVQDDLLLVYQLHYISCRFFMRFLISGVEFKEFSEFYEFFDMPISAHERKRARRILDAADKYFG